MVSQHLSEPEEPHKLPSSSEIELDGDNDSGIEDELRQEGKDSTIFLAFKGNIGDEDFKEKLTKILHNVPNLISMESSHLKVQKVEPWNSVRVTFNIPREAAERLRLLAQSNNQQLRDLGILSVQIEGEGAINLALSQNRGQEVRMNGPLGANNTMRMDAGFAMQSGTGLIRMNNPAAPMMSQGPHVSSAMMAASGSSEMQPRTPRPSQQDAMDPLTSGMTVQQQGHPSGSMAPQLHPMQAAVANRPINPANFQQFQQQARLPQHQQIAQGLRPSFATPAQVPVPPGWNQLASGALQPPPAQGAMGAVTLNQGWKKSPLSGGPMQQQQQFQQRPSLSTVQTPSHPPPPYPFGSQQASQAHANFSSISNPNQFNATPMKPLQGNPARAPTPLQQPHLTSKSPASSPSSFQQSSPASSPTVNQTQQQQQAMGPRGAPGSGMQQSFQQQPVSSPGRGGMMPQGTSPGNFMMQNQGPQGMHSGVPKRLPPGFPSAQGNVNFVAGQTPPSMAGSPVNGTALQQQGNGTGQGTGGQANGSSHNQMQGTNGGPNLMQTNMMALHNNLSNQQTSASGVSQVSVTGLHAQGQQGPPSQLMGMHQQIIPSQGQMVSLQGQAPLNTQGQLVLSRTPLMTQGQMMGTSQNQNIGQAPQRVTPPKPMISSHNQLMTSQGQALMQQNPAVEQIIQGKQGFNTQNQAGVMSGPSSIIRGQAPNMTNNMVQFSGQAVSQQGSVNTNPPQGMNMQGQVLRQTVPGQHLQQPLGETANQAGGDLTSMMPDLSMQQTGNMAAQHMQNMPGNSGLGQHFAGHGLPFSSPFSQSGNGSQMACGQNPSFPVNKDVTLTSPLLVNLLQSDISAGHFGVNSKQNNANAAKPKKKKPPRKKKNPQGEEQMSSTEARMDDSDQNLIAGDQGGSLDGGQKLSEFANRPPGYPAQSLEQRQLQQIPPQLMQLGQQQGQGGQAQQPTPPQQMMMMLMMQQEQKPMRLPGQQGVFNPRPTMNSDAQRMPMQQGANMPVMVSLQGSGPVPPSPDKQRMPMAANVSLANSGRKMSFPESGQNQSGSPLGEGSSASSLPDVPELPATPGPQSNMAPHLLLSQNQLMMAGSKPGASSSMSMVQGASPQQQQHSNAMPGSHGHHFQSVQTPSQTSRPKTPNRASPRPYYPQTPNNRPPSTEPSEISLSPERLNASIAGLFPPQINIPLPPRPTLNRGFDQQGLNPTTLKAIGQAPPGLTVNNQSSFGQHINKVDNGGTKQSNSGGSKRASPSNSRRSSPASSRKTTPSPGRQNSKAAKMVLGVQQNPGLLHSMEMQRNALAGQTSVQNPTLGSTIGQYPPVCMPTTNNPADDTRESPSVTQESSTQAMQMGGKEQGSLDINTVHQEKKLPSPEESARKDSQSMDASKAYTAEDNKTGISHAMRDAPTSLSQLLDHSNVSQSHHSGASQSQHSNGPSLTSKPTGQLNERSPHQMSTEDSKIADLPALSSDVFGTEVTGGPNPAPNTEPCTTLARPDALDVNSNVSMNLPASQLKRTGGPTSLSSSMPPNQITVFVTSNPITPSASVSAPMTSHLQQTLVPTVVNMPNMGNKAMVSEAQQSTTSSARPQFITPVFFNSSSIIQVMKGSQGNMPQPSVAQNTNMMSQSVTVVGPLHISQNIQFPPGQPSSASPSNVTSSTSTTRPVHSNQMQTTSQLASSPSLLPAFPAHAQVKESGLEDANAQSSAPPDLRSPKSLQPTPPPVPDSSQCPSVSGKRSSSAPSSDQCTLDKFSQLLLVKTGNKDGSAEDKLPTDVESPHTVGTDAGNPVVPPSLASQPVSEISHTPTLSLDPTCPANSPPADIMASPSDIHPALEGENGSRNVAFTEQAGICSEDNPTEQHPEKASQCASQEEAAVRDKESVPEKAEADPPETTESEPAERSRPPSRRNSKVDESPASQETVEGGQRKRSARPSSASGSTKESGASPPQPKRRKSK